MDAWHTEPKVAVVLVVVVVGGWGSAEEGSL